ncbi:hypothetical protein QJS10_CPB22g00836 [Acorus calamus]|uniref:Uncharacterized protein n=1 Tax=Acorus calamus TaxID=4465 RepID=A0AAV9C292_ACOCL|nr:hypothetical protein QJS10_CPB22g00836 [Acorus calamus]
MALVGLPCYASVEGVNLLKLLLCSSVSRPPPPIDPFLDKLRPRGLVLESHLVVDLKSRYRFFGPDARDTPRKLGRNGFCQYKDIKMERKTRKA